MRSRRLLALAIAGAAVLLVAGRVIAGLYVEHAWYASLGAADLWWTRAANAALLGLGSWVIAFAVLFGNLFTVRRTVVSLVLPRRVGDIDLFEEIGGPTLTAGAAVIAALLSSILAFAAPRWTTLALARYGGPFNEQDPAFGYDLGFFVEWVPLERSLYEWMLAVVATTAAVVVLLYALTPSLRWERGRIRASGWVRRHLTALGAIVLAMLAWSYRLDAFDLLLHGSGPEGSFAAIDKQVNISTDLLLAVLTFAAAVAVFVAGWLGQVRLALGTVTVVIVASVLLKQALPVVARRLTDTGSEIADQTKYLGSRMSYTRRAYGVDRIGRDDSLSFATAAQAARAVSAWDPVALEAALRRVEGAAPTGDVSWKPDASGLLATSIHGLSDSAALAAEPWRVRGTAVSTVDAAGAPARLELAAAASDPPVEALFFYPGAAGYLVVPDSAGNLPSPSFDHSLTRLAHAWSQQDFRLFFTDPPGARSRILIKRNVRERVEALVPFFLTGSLVAPIIVGDTVLWAVDLYAATDDYPLSERIVVNGEEVNYLHRAGVALVDGRTGGVTLVAEAPQRLEPVGRAWVRRFPSLFSAWEDVSPRIREQIPPAIDGARAQARAYARAGTREESVAGRHVPETDGSDSLVSSGPPPVFAIRRGQGALPAWSTPVIDPDDRVVGTMVATGGAERDPVFVPSRGELRWTPSVARLRRWSDSVGVARGESRLVRGRIQAVPVRDRVVLFQTAYTWRPDAAPSISSVAVLDERAPGIVPPQDALAIDSTSTPARVTAPPDGDVAGRLYQRARAALSRGDWTSFGAAFDSLGALLGHRIRVP